MSTSDRLLPLEYCRIERAARLLGCEVDDILHWGTERKIRLYVNFGFLGMPASIAISKDEPISYVSRHIVNSWASYAFRPDPIPEEDEKPHDNQGTISFVDALLFGFWVVHAKGIQEIYLGFDDTPYSFRWFVGAINGEDGKTVVAQFTDDSYPQIWVMGDDLRLLQKHIQTGEPLPKISNSKSKESSWPDYSPIDELDSVNLDMMTRGKQRIQEDQIISTLKAKGISCKELQKNQPGKKGIKAIIKSELTKLKPALFTLNSFDKAWERLMKDGRIAYL